MDNQLPLEAGEPPDASARLLEDFRVDRNELEVLARDYLEQVNNIDYWMIACGMLDNKTRDFATHRLASIEPILGEDVFAKLVASVYEKWEKELADLEVAIATLKCEECGGECWTGNLFDPPLCQECIDSLNQLST